MHVRNGTPLKIVSERMGHASIQQTADIYQHVSVDATETWMHRFEESWAPKSEPSAAAAN